SAGIKPQIDLDQPERVVQTAHMQPMTFGDRRDGIDTAIAFLGEVDTIATDFARILAGGVPTTVVLRTAGAAVSKLGLILKSPQSTVRKTTACVAVRNDSRKPLAQFCNARRAWAHDGRAGHYHQRPPEVAASGARESADRGNRIGQMPEAATLPCSAEASIES